MPLEKPALVDYEPANICFSKDPMGNITNSLVDKLDKEMDIQCGD